MSRQISVKEYFEFSREKGLHFTSIVKDKNKKANSWKEIGEKFNLSVAMAKVLKTVLKLTMTSRKD